MFWHGRCPHSSEGPKQRYAHSTGDVIEPVYFDDLRAEIDELQRCPIVKKMPGVLEFTLDMQDLIQAGLTEIR